MPQPTSIAGAHLRPTLVSTCTLLLLLQAQKIGGRPQLLLRIVGNRKILLSLLEALQEGASHKRLEQELFKQNNPTSSP